MNDEEVVRVPLAFAMVKLMQSLPREVMESNLPRYAVWHVGKVQWNSTVGFSSWLFSLLSGRREVLSQFAVVYKSQLGNLAYEQIGEKRMFIFLFVSVMNSHFSISHFLVFCWKCVPSSRTEHKKSETLHAALLQK